MAISPLESALIACSPRLFFQSCDGRPRRHGYDPAIPPACSPGFLDGGHSTIAGRLAGAFRNGGRDRFADEITKTMEAAGYACGKTIRSRTSRPSPCPPAKPPLT